MATTWLDPASGDRVRWISRKECGLPRSRAPGGAFTREHGIAHHGVGRGNSLPLRDAMAIWRGYHRYHTRDRGWTDIGYSDGWCDAPDVGGAVLEGRHWGRDGGHTQNGGNTQGYACCYIGDGREPVADTAWRAWRAWLYDGIVNGAFIDPPTLTDHNDWYRKLCAGPEIRGPLHERSHLDRMEPEEDELAKISDENQELLEAMANDMRRDGVEASSLSFVTRAFRAARRQLHEHRDDFDPRDADQVGVRWADRANAGERVRAVAESKDFGLAELVGKCADLVRRSE